MNPAKRKYFVISHRFQIDAKIFTFLHQTLEIFSFFTKHNLLNIYAQEELSTTFLKEICRGAGQPLQHCR